MCKWSKEQVGGASADARSYNRCAESASLFSARVAELRAFPLLVARQTVGALPQTPTRGAASGLRKGENETGRSPPLDPSARLSWSHSLTSSACLSSFCLLYCDSFTIIIRAQLHLLQIRHLLPQNRHIPQGHIRNPIILPIPRQSRCRHFPIQRPQHRQSINQHIINRPKLILDR